jgi:hypothetical protein
MNLRELLVHFVRFLHACTIMCAPCHIHACLPVLGYDHHLSMVAGKLEEDTGLNHPMHRVFEDGRHGLMEGGSLVRRRTCTLPDSADLLGVGVGTV